ncbi:hypothetical protein [Sphingomonas sp. NIBR02145]|uniref:hypothetical protein n=1 Tax=Sphingomonas sp. NIBR02145 TaxID=3014784 RepID=UPI0022B5414F|nr:hypothetical protein [Sphingomonas sp. NIBR02145]WHU04570.1 hypothetical protein O3305_08275 [Sphingomonas sp. NIBR02145]
MALVGTEYLAYVPTEAFREATRHVSDVDAYGALYAVTVNSHARDKTSPSRSDLDAAHWAMFLAVADPELKSLCEGRGFDDCWRVLRLDLESGQDAVEDARSLKR